MLQVAPIQGAQHLVSPGVPPSKGECPLFHALAAWLIVSRFTDIELPHAIYFTWATSIVTFLVVPIFDRRRIAAVKS